MTRDEAIEFFGKEVMVPNLRELFVRNGKSLDAHCRIGSTYWWNAEGPSQFDKYGDWVYQRTKKTGWQKVTCVHRRSGVNFLHIDGDSKSHEMVVFDGSVLVNKLIPVVVDLKAFKQNPELDFVWKTFDGLIKIVK